MAHNGQAACWAHLPHPDKFAYGRIITTILDARQFVHNETGVLILKLTRCKQHRTSPQSISVTEPAKM